MSPLTDETPKSMLRVDGVPLLERILDQVVRLTSGEVNVVTGYLAEQVEALVARRFSGRVRCVRNSRYAEDTNILSVDVGVDHLARPELGYTIIETDLLVERAGWETVFAAHRGQETFWVTRGRYGPDLLGGIVHTDSEWRVDAVEYKPTHDRAYDGWLKMLGVLSVGPACVAADRGLRKRAIARTTRQYYLEPWVDNLALLPCRAVDLGDRFAQSFNTPEAFAFSCRAYLALEPGSTSECA